MFACSGPWKTALSFKASYDVTGHWSFGLDLSGASGGGADTGTLETDLGKFLHDVAAATAEDGRGLALLIDEAQDLTRDELTAVCAVVHRAGQDGWNLLVTLAGLPSLPRELSEAKSYSERLFSYAHIEQLEDELARRALTEPAWVEGVSWSPDAVDLIVAETSGYPYFLQQFGQDSWNEAVASPITWDDARVGAAKGRAALDTGFFRARWDRATRSEQRYLRVMAADGDNGSSSGVVAERLGKRPTSLGPTRAVPGPASSPRVSSLRPSTGSWPSRCRRWRRSSNGNLPTAARKRSRSGRVRRRPGFLQSRRRRRDQSRPNPPVHAAAHRQRLAVAERHVPRIIASHGGDEPRVDRMHDTGQGPNRQRRDRTAGFEFYRETTAGQADSRCGSSPN